MAILEVQHLSKSFHSRARAVGRGAVRAVHDVSFTLEEGETLSVVGESGSGKSTLGRTIVKLYEPTSGAVFLEGRNIAGLSQRRMVPYRRNIQMVFQDPMGSLNPRMKVRDSVVEPLRSQGVPKKERRKVAEELFERVGLQTSLLERYPHEFSGGQRQRIGIARALSGQPKIIILDEPTSALDVSVQAQILNLLRDLQEESGIAYLFISHNLAVVSSMSDRVAVMYRGEFVEVGTRDQIFNDPQDSYTRSLLSAIPIEDPTLRGTTVRKRSNSISGSISRDEGVHG